MNKHQSELIKFYKNSIEILTYIIKLIIISSKILQIFVKVVIA